MTTKAKVYVPAPLRMVITIMIYGISIFKIKNVCFLV